jgi:hypothetical protein
MEKKLSVGLVSYSRAEESNIRKELGSFNLGNLSVSTSHLELLQKSLGQKFDLIVYLEDQKEAAENFIAIPTLLKSKKHLAEVPICLMIRGEKAQINGGYFDRSVRAFPMSLGYFLPMSVMIRIARKNESSVTKIIDENWMLKQIEKNFSQNLGELRCSASSDEEKNCAYLYEQVIECRTHIFWLKANIRLIKVSEPLRKTAEAAGVGIDDFIEEKVRPIAYEIEKQVEQDLISEGAIFLPYLEDLNPEGKKIVLANRKNLPVTLTHKDFTFFVELTRYL